MAGASSVLPKIQCVFLMTRNRNRTWPCFGRASAAQRFLYRRLAAGRDVLLIVEVVGTSLGFDRDVKRLGYAAADSAEAWLVDLKGDVIERYIRPLNGRYAEVVTFQHGETLKSTMLDLSIAADDILGQTS